jgi:ATP/ADP translocase
MRIHQFLNLHPDEVPRAKSLFWIQLFSGIGQAFLYIVASTLLLSKLGYTGLIQGFIAAGISVLLFQNVYHYLEHHWHLKKTYLAVLVFSVFSCGLAFLLMPDGQTPWFYLALFALYHLLYYLNNTAFWGIAAISFNLRESKRIFNIIGSGDIPSKMLGYGLVAVSARYLDISYLIIFSMMAFLAAFFAFRGYKARFAVDRLHHDDDFQAVSGGSSHWVSLRLMRSVAWLAILFSVSFTLIDFTFLTRVKSAYYTYGELASFLAMFFAISRMAALVIKLLLSSRIQQKLGINQTLLLLPVMILGFAVATLILNQQIHPLIKLYAFGALVVVAETLKSTLYEPYYFALFQALPKPMRLKGHNLAKGIMIPAGQAIAGLVLLWGLSQAPDQHLFFATWLLIPVAGAWTVVIYFTSARYFQTVRQRLEKHSFLSLADPQLADSAEVKDWLTDKITRGDAEEVVVSLSYLRQWHPDTYRQYAETLLTSEIRKPVLSFLVKDKSLRIHDVGYAHLEAISHQMATHESGDPLAGDLLFFLSAARPENISTYLQWADQADNLDLTRECLAGAMQSSDLNAIILSGQRLLEWLSCAGKRYVEAGIAVIQRADQPMLFRQLLRFTTEENKAYHVQVLAALRFSSEKAFLPFIVRKLQQPEFRDAAKSLLVEKGNWLEELQHDAVSLLPREHWIDLLRRCRHPVALQLLEEAYNRTEMADPLLIQVMYLKKLKPANMSKLQAWSGQFLLETKKIHQWVEEGPSIALRSALVEEGVSRIILQVEIAGIQQALPEIETIRAILVQRRKHQYPFALEMLEKWNKGAQASSFISEAESFLFEKYRTTREGKAARLLLENRTIRLHPWTLALALYENGSQGHEDLLDLYPHAIIEQLIQNNPHGHADH